MAEEFQGGICGGNLWSSSRSVLMAPSPCSVGLNHDVAGFGWPGHDLIVDIKARSSSGDTNSVCESTCGFQDVLQKPPHQSHNNFNSVSGSGTALNIDSTLQMMGFGLSTSPTSDLNQANNFVTTRRAESNNIYSMLQEDNMQGGNKLSYRQEIGLLDSSNYQIQKDFSSNGGTVATTSQALSAGFPVSSASYGYGNPETLLQSLFDGEQHSFSNSNNNRSMDYNSSPTPNYGSNLGNNNMMSSSWPRFSAPNKQLQQPHGGLHFSNNTPFWNATAAEAAGPNDNNSILRVGLFPSVLPQQLQYATPTMFEEKPKCNNVLTTKPINVSNEDVQDSGSVEKRSSTTNGNDNHHNPPVLKRARIETPSPLPTFKVRKEKLGDRITALQQLVSPFGKTDTASVLQEAIDYIRFLHDQVSVLSTPYMKNGASVQVQQQGSTKVPKDQEVSRKQDLKSRGLCLVPISSTFPVANETTADFWTPTFGGTFR